MSRRLLSSLLLLSSLSFGACASSTSADSTRPAIVAPQPALDRAEVRAALAARRTESVKRFVAFREGRVYPINTTTDGALHIWMDDAGHLCAAATLVSLDWGVAASQAIAAENNAIDLADVHDGAIADWMLTTGLTHQEIVAIQRPSPKRRPERPTAAVTETERIHEGWIDVERQITVMWEENLDAATDALMAQPALARQLLDGVAAGPGKYARIG